MSDPGPLHAASSSQPLISIIIPAYNAQTYIEATLQSALDQTYNAIEIIVVDDGSNDETAAIVGRVQAIDPRLKLIRIANGGVSQARNRGIAESTGDYIAFLDADDLWRPEKLEAQLAELARCGPDYAAVYTLHYVIDDNDRVIRPGNSIVATGFILSRHLTFRFVGNGSTLLVRRSALFTTTLFDPDLSGGEDLDIELQLAERYLIAAVPERLVGYRFHEGSLSSDKTTMVRGVDKVNRRALARNQFLSPKARRLCRTSQYRYAFDINIAGGRLLGSLKFGSLYLANDPVAFAKFMVHKTIAMTYRRFGRPSPFANREEHGHAFIDASPTQGVRYDQDGPAWQYLTQEDEKRERELFPHRDGAGS